VAGNHFALTFTAMFPYAFQFIFPAKAPKTAENQNGMVVAQSHYDCFCTNETWAWLTKGGEQNALDDFRDSVGPVVTGLGEWLRDRWVHSYSACDRSGSATYQHNWRP
jgi:hypothetical protein